MPSSVPNLTLKIPDMHPPRAKERLQQLAIANLSPVAKRSFSIHLFSIPIPSEMRFPNSPGPYPRFWQESFIDQPHHTSL